MKDSHYYLYPLTLRTQNNITTLNVLHQNLVKEKPRTVNFNKFNWLSKVIKMDLVFEILIRTL